MITLEVIIVNLVIALGLLTLGIAFLYMVCEDLYLDSIPEIYCFLSLIDRLVRFLKCVVNPLTKFYSHDNKETETEQRHNCNNRNIYPEESLHKITNSIKHGKESQDCYCAINDSLRNINLLSQLNNREENTTGTQYKNEKHSCPNGNDEQNNKCEHGQNQPFTHILIHMYHSPIQLLRCIIKHRKDKNNEDRTEPIHLKIF
jgi:hypothetical protein